MDELMIQFVKLMAQLNADITNYVVLGAITPEQYKEFTGKVYVQPVTQPQA